MKPLREVFSVFFGHSLEGILSNFNKVVNDLEVFIEKTTYKVHDLEDEIDALVEEKETKENDIERAAQVKDKIEQLIS